MHLMSCTEDPTAAVVSFFSVTDWGRVTHHLSDLACYSDIGVDYTSLYFFNQAARLGTLA